MYSNTLPDIESHFNCLSLNKSLSELLAEVSIGNFHDFQLFIKQHHYQSFILTHSMIDNSSMQYTYLGQALGGTTITSLSLCHNVLDHKAVKALAIGLKGTAIKNIDLSFTNLEESGAVIFGQNLFGSSIVNINLTSTQLGNSGAIAFINTLPGTNVRSINLGLNRLNARVVQPLAQALAYTSINTINFYGNHLSNDGAHHLGYALGKTSIISVDLKNNFIGDLGLYHFSKGIAGSQVTNVDFSFNPIKDFGARVLSQILGETQLLNVKISYNRLHKSAKKVVKQALTENMSKLILAPYYTLCLALMPKSEKNKHFNCSVALSPTKEPLRYAGGILMHLPEDLLIHTLGYFPLMTTQKGKNQAPKYLALARKRHVNGVKMKKEKKIKKIMHGLA